VERERVTITIDAENLEMDRSRKGSWAQAMRRLLNELAFRVGNGEWEFDRRTGFTQRIYDPDGTNEVGTVEIHVRD
jgi:hypothetical protein